TGWSGAAGGRAEGASSRGSALRRYVRGGADRHWARGGRREGAAREPTPRGDRGTFSTRVLEADAARASTPRSPPPPDERHRTRPAESGVEAPRRVPSRPTGRVHRVDRADDHGPARSPRKRGGAHDHRRRLRTAAAARLLARQ